MFLLLHGFLLTSSPSLFTLSLSRCSHSRGVSVEILPGRGFGATCCACVSFAREIVRDSPMVNFDSQTMNKHIKVRLGHRAANSMLPGNAKCSMTSLADTKHIFRCATNADCRLADRRPADLQTCRLADLLTCRHVRNSQGG